MAVQAGGVTTYVDDAFSRIVSGAWGAAPLGGPWTTIGSAAAFTVDGASGNLSMAANANRAAVLTNVSERDVDLVADLTTDRAAVNGRHYVYALVRRINDTNEYRAKIRFGPGTALFVQTVRLVNNVETAIGPEVQVPGLAYTPGTPLRLRVQASGASPTTLRMRVWPAAGAEPSAWHWTGSDSSAALQAAGAVGIRSYLDGSVTNGPIRLSVDALRVTSIAASGPNTAPVVDAVSVTPASATTTSTLTASVTAHDAEGDALLTAYQWTRNGADIPGAASASLNLGTPGAGDRGDSIAVRVTVSDGQAVSPAATSSPVVVADSPSVATVTLSPPSPLPSATLTATAGVTDADGDAVSLRYTWALNGVVASSGTATTFSFAGVAQPGDVASVQVEPRFGDDTPSGPAVSASVTYASATPPPTTYVDDPFARTLSGAWGSAPTGGAWTLSGTAADFAVSAGAGTISMAAGANRAAVLPVSVRDVDLRLDLSTDRLSVGGLHFVYALVRRVNTTNEYRAKLRLGPGGAVFVQFNRLVGNVESAVGPEVQVPGLTFSSGLVLHLRAQAEGASPTALRMRVWAGATEPSTWQWTGTDSSAALQAPGAIGVRSYLDAGVTNGRVALRIDDVRATSIPTP